MNYKKIYNNIINNAQKRSKIEGYSEKHHIIPVCMKGMSCLKNIVKLTAREHYVCHWLLVKIYPKEWKLYFAFFQMTKKHNHERIINSRQFETARKVLSQGAKMRYMLGLHPRKTDKGRKVLSEKMKGDNNPMRKHPEKNHTARPHTVFFEDGTTKTYLYGKLGYTELNISRSSWIKAVRTGNPIPKFKVLKITQ
jgi:hypothetical protein